MMSMPKTLKPEMLTVIVDTREQLPFNFAPMKWEIGTLPTGDYSILGLEHKIAVERKSLSDILGCMGGGRERFDKEIQRLLAYEVRAIFCEGSFEDIDTSNHRSQLHPNAIYGALLGWQAKGVPIIMAGSRPKAEQLMKQFLWIASNRYYRELLTFSDSL